MSAMTTSVFTPGTFASAFVTWKDSFFRLLLMIVTVRFTGSAFGSKLPKLTDRGVTESVGLM